MESPQSATSVSENVTEVVLQSANSPPANEECQREAQTQSVSRRVKAEHEDPQSSSEGVKESSAAGSAWMVHEDQVLRVLGEVYLKGEGNGRAPAVDGRKQDDSRCSSLEQPLEKDMPALGEDDLEITPQLTPDPVGHQSAEMASVKNAGEPGDQAVSQESVKRVITSQLTPEPVREQSTEAESVSTEEQDRVQKEITLQLTPEPAGEEPTGATSVMSGEDQGDQDVQQERVKKDMTLQLTPDLDGEESMEASSMKNGGEQGDQVVCQESVKEDMSPQLTPDPVCEDSMEVHGSSMKNGQEQDNLAVRQQSVKRDMALQLTPDLVGEQSTGVASVKNSGEQGDLAMWQESVTRAMAPQLTADPVGKQSMEASSMKNRREPGDQAVWQENVKRDMTPKLTPEPAGEGSTGAASVMSAEEQGDQDVRQERVKEDMTLQLTPDPDGEESMEASSMKNGGEPGDQAVCQESVKEDMAPQLTPDPVCEESMEVSSVKNAAEQGDLIVRQESVKREEIHDIQKGLQMGLGQSWDKEKTSVFCSEASAVEDALQQSSSDTVDSNGEIRPTQKTLLGECNRELGKEAVYNVETWQEEGRGGQEDGDVTSTLPMLEDAPPRTNLSQGTTTGEAALAEANAGVQAQVVKALENVCKRVFRAQSSVAITGDLSFCIDNESILTMAVSHLVRTVPVFKRKRGRPRKATSWTIKTEVLPQKGSANAENDLHSEFFEGENANEFQATAPIHGPKLTTYQCPYCAYSTRYKGFFRKHQRTKHSQLEFSESSQVSHPPTRISRPRRNLRALIPKKEPLEEEQEKEEEKEQEEEGDQEDLANHLGNDSNADNDDVNDVDDEDDDGGDDDIKDATFEPGEDEKLPPDSGSQPKRATRSSTQGKFSCTLCEYVTDHSGHFRDHMNRHSGVKPHPCMVCGKSFIRLDDLKKHEERHSLSYECSMCSEHFSERLALKEHMKEVHDETGRLMLFPCDICKKSLPTHQDLLRHLDLKHNHICSICGEHFAHVKELKQHKHQQHPKEALTCTICVKTCASKGALRKHMHRHRAGNSFPCDLCGRSFTAQSTLYHHKRGVHSDLKPYQCGKCDKRFNFHHSLKLHMLQHDGVRPYKCDVCDKTYLTATHLKSHKQAVHSDLKKYVCVICNKRFPYENSLKMHMMLHTGDRPYLCNLCGRGFVNHSALKTHEASHVDSKEWECDICKKMYKTEALMRAHRRRHTQEGSRFMCDICGHTFMYKSNLEAHYTVHSNERKYTCKECGATFKTAATLYSHRLVHKTETPFTCAVCNKAFKSKERKLAHEKRHLGDKPYQCEICGRSFPDKGGLSKHSKTVHSKVKRFSCPVCKKTCSRADNLRVHMRVHRDPALLKMDWKSLMTVDVDETEEEEASPPAPASAGRRDVYGGGSGAGPPESSAAVSGAGPGRPSQTVSSIRPLPGQQHGVTTSLALESGPLQRHLTGQSSSDLQQQAADLRQPTDLRQPASLRQATPTPPQQQHQQQQLRPAGSSQLHHAHHHMHQPQHHHNHHQSPHASMLVVPDPSIQHHLQSALTPTSATSTTQLQQPPQQQQHQQQQQQQQSGIPVPVSVSQHHLVSLSQVIPAAHSLTAPPPAHHPQQATCVLQDYDTLCPTSQDALRSMQVVMPPPPAAHAGGSTEEGQAHQSIVSSAVRDYAEVLYMQYHNLQNSSHPL